MTKHVKSFPMSQYRIEEVLSWIKKNVPQDHMSGVNAITKDGVRRWEVEWTTEE